jgi:hypothetical protein
MKPVKRKIRRHFGLTAKQVAVRSHRPWYFQTILGLICAGLGFGLAYWLLHDNEGAVVRQQLQESTIENKELATKLVGAQRELQIELATNNNLAKELATVQDDNIKIKEDLFFYKNMLEGKKSK